MKKASLTTAIILRLKKFFKSRASQYYVEMVFLYGSLVSGQPRSDSDVDLAILFSDEIDSPEKIYSLITEITYELTQKLNKEVHPIREFLSNGVNIVSIDKNFSHPMLYYNAIVLGIPMFIKDGNKLLNLKLEAIHQMEDFQIYGVAWQREIARKILQGVTYA